jgi:hypothetical protein
VSPNTTFGIAVNRSWIDRQSKERKGATLAEQNGRAGKGSCCPCAAMAAAQRRANGRHSVGRTKGAEDQTLARESLMTKARRSSLNSCS